MSERTFPEILQELDSKCYRILHEGERTPGLNARQYAEVRRVIAKVHEQEVEISNFRKALNEMKGMLGAHEHAIRSDAGNTNWQVMIEKVNTALGEE